MLHSNRPQSRCSRPGAVSDRIYLFNLQRSRCQYIHPFSFCSFLIPDILRRAQLLSFTSSCRHTGCFRISSLPRKNLILTERSVFCRLLPHASVLAIPEAPFLLPSKHLQAGRIWLLPMQTHAGQSPSACTLLSYVV